MKIILNYIKDYIFGKPIKGEPINSPSFKTTHPTTYLSEQEWKDHFKFGNRYGHRGSFYQKS